MAENAQSILIIKPSSLGDVVHTLPAVARIRDRYPKATITWVINPEWAPLLRGNPDIDHVHIFPRGKLRGLGVSGNLWPWLRRVRALRPDVALDFQGLFRSAFIGRASGARRLWGMSDSREGSRFFYHEIAPVDRRAHAIERYQALAEAFAGAPIAPSRCPLPTGDRLTHFDDHPPYVLLHPFARGGGKSLSPRVIEEICKALDPTRVVVVGREGRRFTVRDNCVNLTNQTTLLQLIWLIRAAAFVISVDSGPMHIAAAITAKLLSIHTWTNPRRVGPFNPEARLWRSGKIMRVADYEESELTKKGQLFRVTDVQPMIDALRAEHVLPD